MARPKGSTNKLKAGRAHEICEEENDCPFRTSLKIARELYMDGKLVEAARVYNNLLKYLYAPLAPITLSGETAPVNLLINDPQRLEEEIVRIREINAKTT